MLNSAKSSFLFDGRFWDEQKAWPHDPHGYVFLARAFHEIGHRVFRDRWPESRDDKNPEEPEEPDEECDDETEERFELVYEKWEQACAQVKIDLEDMWNRLSGTIAEACEVGTLVSAARAKDGGEMIILDAYYWNTENFLPRFFRCDISLTHPYAKSRFNRSHWIYVTRDSLDRYLEQTSTVDVVTQPDRSEGSHQVGSDLSIGKASRPVESKARIRAELRKIYADPVNDRPNVNAAWRLLHDKLPNARENMVQAVLGETEFSKQRRGAGQRRGPGNKPKPRI